MLTENGFSYCFDMAIYPARILISDGFHKFIFFAPGYIERNTIFHYYLAPFALYIFFHRISIDDMGMMYTDKSGGGQ